MSSVPKVSIILPVYNAAAYLEAAIMSAVNQSWRDFELIIIDDASIDASPVIAARWAARDDRITVLHNEHNLRLQRTLNRGLRHARGEYIARLDSDDIWYPEKLEKQLARLAERPGIVLLGASAAVGATPEKIGYISRNPSTDEAIRRKLLGRNCFIHSSVVFSRAAARRCGGYEEGEGYRHVEDYSLWLKLGREGELGNLDEPLLFYRLSGEQISAKNRQAQFWRSIQVAAKHRHDYPGAARGLLSSLARLVLYGFFGFSPAQLKRRGGR